jgi:hypothetical protein
MSESARMRAVQRDLLVGLALIVPLALGLWLNRDHFDQTTQRLLMAAALIFGISITLPRSCA